MREWCEGRSYEGRAGGMQCFPAAAKTVSTWSLQPSADHNEEEGKRQGSTSYALRPAGHLFSCLEEPSSAAAPWRWGDMHGLPARRQRCWHAHVSYVPSCCTHSALHTFPDRASFYPCPPAGEEPQPS